MDLGYTASMFHLFTHAFFKALLFLGAGAVIHFIHSNEMKDMGGLRKYYADYAYLAFLLPVWLLQVFHLLQDSSARKKFYWLLINTIKLVYWIALFTSGLLLFICSVYTFLFSGIKNTCTCMQSSWRRRFCNEDCH